MKRFPSIYLLRHGDTVLKTGQHLVGRLDVDLSDLGVSQARWWRTNLEQVPFEGVYCSDLGRSIRTAEIIADGKCKPEILPELREISLGEWEGLSIAEAKERFPEQWEKRGQDLPGYPPPGGESFSDLESRVVPAFERIAQTLAADVLIVGHAGVNRVILCHVLGMPLANLFRLGQDYAALNIIELNGPCRRVRVLNVPSSSFPSGTNPSPGGHNE